MVAPFLLRVRVSLRQTSMSLRPGRARRRCWCPGRAHHRRRCEARTSTCPTSWLFRRACASTGRSRRGPRCLHRSRSCSKEASLSDESVAATVTIPLFSLHRRAPATVQASAPRYRLPGNRRRRWQRIAEPRRPCLARIPPRLMFAMAGFTAFAVTQSIPLITPMCPVPVTPDT